MRTGRGRISRVVVVRCDRGEDLLECLRAAVKEHGIESGVIMTGYGTLDRSTVHMVTTTGFPAEEYFDRKESPLEVLSLDGTIADGEIHAHMVVSDTESAYGGHLEPGCRCLYLCEAVIGILDDIVLSRQTDPNGLRLLQIKEQ